MRKELKRIYHMKINHLDFILYSNGLCRVDNDEQFSTTHYTGKDRLKWWSWFERTAKENNIPPLVIDKAFCALTGI